MHEFENLVQMLPYLVPLIILEAALLLVALIDLSRRKHVAGGNKLIWVAVILLIQYIGPVIYFIAGRKEEQVESD